MNYNIINFLADDNTAVAPWVASSFPIIKIVLCVLLLVCAIFMIVAVIAQKGEANGLTGITGGTADTFYNRNKKGSLQGVIRKLVMIDAVLILVIGIAFLFINCIYAGTI
jgi:protein translocase SecG subunit